MDETKGTTPQRKSKGEKKKCEKQKNQKKKTKRRNIYTVYKKSWRKDWRNSGSFGTNISIASEATRSRK
jgi:hypothetical protein